MPSTSYSNAIIPHLLGTEFNVRRAQPLEEDCFEVREEDIHEYFRNLNERGISVTSRHLILNLDETRFGSSKSGRMKSRQVIVPSSFHGTPVYRETTDSHFVTALCAISLAGDVLTPQASLPNVGRTTLMELSAPTSPKQDAIPVQKRLSLAQSSAPISATSFYRTSSAGVRNWVQKRRRSSCLMGTRRICTNSLMCGPRRIILFCALSRRIHHIFCSLSIKAFSED
jgi:hypothetical protein